MTPELRALLSTPASCGPAHVCSLKESTACSCQRWPLQRPLLPWIRICTPTFMDIYSPGPVSTASLLLRITRGAGHPAAQPAVAHDSGGASGRARAHAEAWLGQAARGEDPVRPLAGRAAAAGPPVRRRFLRHLLRVLRRHAVRAHSPS